MPRIFSELVDTVRAPAKVELLSTKREFPVAPYTNVKLARTGFCFDLMKNSEEESSRFVDFQIRFSHQFQRLSVPVTPELFREPIRRSVLKSRKPFAIASAMLQQKNLAL